MKLISLPDLHGGIKYIDRAAECLADADVVLLPGDITTLGSVEDMQAVIGAVRRVTTARILGVPGNWDTRDAARYLKKADINLHRRHVIIDGVAFIGAGGSLPYGDNSGRQILYDNIQLEEFLHEAVKGLSRRTPLVLVTHHPPLGTKMDMLWGDENFGSRTIRTFIEKHQPLLCVCGHIHAAQGIDRIGETVIMNPGPLWMNRTCGYAEIDRGILQTARVLSVDS